MERPAEISRSIYLIWGALGLQAASLALLVSRGSDLFLDAMIVVSIIFIAIEGVVAIFILRGVAGGKRWARAFVSVFLVLIILYLLDEAGRLLANPVPSDALGVIAALLVGYAVKLMFTPPGRDWFARKAP